MSMIQAEAQTQTPPDNQLLSSDPEKAMQEMMETIDSLRDVYVRETDALESVDTKAFLDIQEEKLSAAKRYQMNVEQMLARREELKEVNPLLRKRLEEMQAEFAELSKKNVEALERMQRTTDRLGDTIRDAAKEAAKKNNAFSYGESGTMHGAEKKSVSMGVSETA